MPDARGVGVSEAEGELDIDEAGSAEADGEGPGLVHSNGKRDFEGDGVEDRLTDGVELSVTEKDIEALGEAGAAARVFGVYVVSVKTMMILRVVRNIVLMV